MLFRSRPANDGVGFLDFILQQLQMFRNPGEQVKKGKEWMR
jgi:hypothetical protein